MNKCIRYKNYHEPLTERHIQALWYDQAFRPQRLFTKDGELVQIVYPGDWNLAAGPDFKNAVLEIGEERRRMKGDVEVHLNPSSWITHGHGSDPAYQNVIAHITWGCGPVPATLPPHAVSIWIGHFLSEQIGFTPEVVDLSAYPFARLPQEDRPCYEQLRNSPQLAQDVLFAAGEYRLRTKARRLTSILALRPLSRYQIFYEEVMSALGYKRNARGFRQVAEAVPYDRLVAEPENAASALLTAANFIEWNRIGLRPLNFPENRLLAAAQLFTSTAITELLEADTWSVADLHARQRLLMAAGLMGLGRAAAILSNVVVPFALAQGLISTIPVWLPPEDLSEPVRLTAFRMFGRDHHPRAVYAKNNLCIQGLIQIHRDYCLALHPFCQTCSVVKDYMVAQASEMV